MMQQLQAKQALKLPADKYTLQQKPTLQRHAPALNGGSSNVTMTKRVSMGGTQSKEGDIIGQLSNFMVQSQTNAEKFLQLEETVTAHRRTITDQRKLLDRYRNENAQLKEGVTELDKKVKDGEEMTREFAKSHQQLQEALIRTSKMVEADEKVTKDLIEWRKLHEKNIIEGQQGMGTAREVLQELLQKQKETIGVLESNLATKTAELEKKLQDFSKLEGDHAKYAEEAMRSLSTEKCAKDEALQKLGYSKEREEILNRDIKEIKLELKEQEKKTKKADDHGRTLTCEKTELSKKLTNMEIEEMNLKKIIREFEATSTKEAENLRKLGAELATNKSKISVLEGVIRASAMEAKEKDKHASNLEKKAKNLEKEIESAHSTIATLEEQISKLNDDLATTSEACNAANEERAALASKASTLEESAEKSAKELNEQSKAIDAKAKEAEKLQKDIDQAVAKLNKEHAAELKKISKENEKNTQKVLDAARAITQERETSLQSQIDTFKSREAALQGEFDALKMEMDKLRNEVDHSRVTQKQNAEQIIAQNEQLIKDKAELEGRVELISTEKGVLAKKVAEVVAENAKILDEARLEMQKLVNTENSFADTTADSLSTTGHKSFEDLSHAQESVVIQPPKKSGPSLTKKFQKTPVLALAKSRLIVPKLKTSKTPEPNLLVLKLHEVLGPNKSPPSGGDTKASRTQGHCAPNNLADTIKSDDDDNIVPVPKSRRPSFSSVSKKMSTTFEGVDNDTYKLPHKGSCHPLSFTAKAKPDEDESEDEMEIGDSKKRKKKVEPKPSRKKPSYGASGRSNKATSSKSIKDSISAFMNQQKDTPVFQLNERKFSSQASSSSSEFNLFGE